ncbi:uncharacterized protein LOC114936669 [Nylanderia fulva]|uniref:uncharacterized protein LOC114936669 n=1 Tax=Nylanderia fulva TaxID=613905 RepID=UPI0010FB8E62|nr:uncharacterized protein LOC114936669 [Nylanderia fulva]
MTPTFCWVFLLACLVGRAASMPQPLVVDACALICNPGAETESERERDPSLYPRYPKVDCSRQSDKDESQAWVITSNCLKLCNVELSVQLEVNCFALRSSLGANLGCYCEALTPLSPNTIRLNEDWKMNFLVKELSNDLLSIVTDSPLDELIICDIHKELLNNTKLATNKFSNCYPKDEPVNEKIIETKEDKKEDGGENKQQDKKQEESEHHISGKPDIFRPDGSPGSVDDSKHKMVRRSTSRPDSRPIDEVVTSRDDEDEEEEQEREKKVEVEVEAEEEKKPQGPTEKEEVKMPLPVNGNPAPEEATECELCLSKCERPDYKGVCDCKNIKETCAKYIKQQVS